MSDRLMVSAVIRTYKRANLVGRAIESVLNQTFKNYELIIIDDCSPDNTSEVVQRYIDINERVRYIRNEINKGTGASFNIANCAAQGKYIAYLDDDDVWLPRKLELQVAKIEARGEEYGLVTGGVRRIDMDTGKMVNIFKPKHEGSIYWDMLRIGSGLVVGPPSVIMLRASIVKKLGGFNEHLQRGCGQDYFRQLAKVYKITYVSDICLDYYVHAAQITTCGSIEAVRKDIFSREYKLLRFGDDLKKIPEAYAHEITVLGTSYIRNGQMRKGRLCFLNAIKANGFDLKMIFRLILSFFGKSICNYCFALYNKLKA